MKSRLESSVKEVLEQIKKAGKALQDLEDKVTHIDKEAAKATLEALKDEGLKEAHKIKERLEEKVVVLSKELSKAAVKMKDESEHIRSRVDKTLKVVKQQIKGMTEKERTKRRSSKD